MAAFGGWRAETAGLHLAHLNDARPVSCHHPMNTFIPHRLSSAGGSTGEKWIETGFYLGKVDLCMPTLFTKSITNDPLEMESSLRQNRQTCRVLHFCNSAMWSGRVDHSFSASDDCVHGGHVHTS